MKATKASLTLEAHELRADGTRSAALPSSALAWLGALALVAACGGNVDVDPPGGSGGSGAGTTTGTTTGMGGAAPAACEGLGHVACLGAYPSCAPIYDDVCCPFCDPVGGCADCINIQFHHCAPFQDACGGPQSIPCESAPGWACAGEPAPCGDPGGSPVPCATAPGCVAAYCALDADCETDPVCTPVTAGSCTVACESEPPPCPGGTVAEGDGACYTGNCIPAELCGG
jgi:hypothetical protein